MAGRRFTRGVIRGARRATSWFDIEPAGVVLTVTGGTITHTMTATELAKRPFTVIRTHIFIHITSDQSAASENQFGAFGACVVSSQAAAIGVTAVPTPSIDAASDLWFLHGWFASSLLFASAVGFDASDGRVFNYDSKAQRKVNDDQQIVLVAGLSGGVSSGIAVSIAGRMLIKET